jgi:hypothetical protein
MASSSVPAAPGMRWRDGAAAKRGRMRHSPTARRLQASASPSVTASQAGSPQASALASTPPRRPSASTPATNCQPAREARGRAPAGAPRPAQAASSHQSSEPANQPAMWAPPCVQPLASSTSVSAPSTAAPSPKAATAPRDKGASGADEGGLGRFMGFRAWTGSVGAGLIVVGRCVRFTARLAKDGWQRDKLQ